METLVAPDTLKLNLGAGKSPMDGYENLDRKTGQEIFPLAYPDESADEIRASHVLEHFSHRDTEAVIADWVRVLKPGGLLKIAVPNLETVAALVVDGQNVNAQGYLMGGHLDDNDHHGALFTPGSLAQIFMDAGLERVSYWASDYDDCSSLPVSLNLQARKPLVEKGKLPFSGVHGVLPTPRYGPSEHHRCIYLALAELGMTIHSVSGCFWNQHLCEAMEEEIAKPECRYIMTFDYDSIFKVQDIVDLYRIMETHPHIDAIVPMQSHRGAPTPLFTIAGKSEVPMTLFDKLTVEIATGHMGLTFMRAEKLHDLPRPWMVGVPNSDGRWGEGKIDPDIYFWKNWRENGRKVHLASRVVIGHLEDCILWPHKDTLEPIYQRVNDYLKNGKPPEAR